MRTIKQIYESMLNEGFADYNKANQLITSYLNKHKVYAMHMFDRATWYGTEYWSTLCWPKNGNNGALLCWKKDIGFSSEIDGILLTTDVDKAMSIYQEGGKFNFDVAINGAKIGVSKAMQLIVDAINGNVKIDKKSIEEYIGQELMNESLISEDLTADLTKQINSLKKEITNAEKLYGKGSPQVEELTNKRKELMAQRKLAKIQVSNNVKADISGFEVEHSVEDEFEERIDPELRFQDMEGYVQMVIKGLKPLAILCGAPGVGKTFRVKKLIRGLGKHISTSGYKDIGTDAIILKGSETAVSLFIKMFQFKDQGDLIVLDDCDKVLKDETAINLIKAATDSDDERVVSYGTSRPPECPAALAEIHPEWNLEMDSKGRYYFPQSFVFKGSMVIITNMRAGMIDTAIRNRGLICDLDFTTEEILGIVESLAPKIDPEHIGMAAKQKAIEYLKNLAQKGSDMEISIRSFMTCAGLYECCDDAAACERRIKEQMKLQFASGGKRY